jgi:hypothetical protein
VFENDLSTKELDKQSKAVVDKPNWFGPEKSVIFSHFLKQNQQLYFTLTGGNCNSLFTQLHFH